MGITLNSTGGKANFTLENLSKMAQSVGDNDKIRGKETQKGESFTLYSSSKGEGFFKTGKRELKQQHAKDYLQTVFNNTLANLPPSLREGRLSYLLTNIVEKRELKEIKGSDLKSIVNEANDIIAREIKALLGNTPPTQQTLQSFTQDQEKADQLKKLIELLPKDMRQHTGVETLEALGFTWVNMECGLEGKIPRESLGQAQTNLRTLVENEFSKGQINPGTILRGNSCSTKYSSAFMKSVGGEYTVSMMKPTLDDLAKAGNLEMDPSKIEISPKDLKKGETIQVQQQKIAKENAVKLGEIYDKLMNTLTGSVKLMPQEMRDTCALTYALIKRAGGDEQTARNGASATIILRLLSPALTSPEKNAPIPGSLGMIQNKDHQRGAMLLSKVFQNQANSTLNFDKDPTLKPLTDKLTKNDLKLQSFLNEVIKAGNVPQDLKEFLP